MNKSPLVSVVMPVYNTEKYLHESIESILNQTYENLEFIIINDGSTDKTEEVILSYGDPRIIYLKNEENLKIEESLNRGIKIARGEYIIRMDADDISLPQRIERQLHFMQENPDIDICGGWLHYFNEEGDMYVRRFPETHEEIKVYMLFYTGFAHDAIIVKKSFYDRFNYRRKYHKAEDYDLWIRTIDQFKFYNMQEVVTKCRRHEDQTTHAPDRRQGWLQVREDYLSRIGCILSKKEMEFFELLILSENQEYMQIEKLIKKLLVCNKKSHYFDKKVLQTELEKYYWYIINCNTNKGIKILFIFLRSGLQNYLKLSFFDYIKFTIKCMLRYTSCNLVMGNTNVLKEK